MEQPETPTMRDCAIVATEYAATDVRGSPDQALPDPARTPMMSEQRRIRAADDAARIEAERTVDRTRA